MQDMLQQSLECCMLPEEEAVEEEDGVSNEANSPDNSSKKYIKQASESSPEFQKEDFIGMIMYISVISINSIYMQALSY